MPDIRWQDAINVTRVRYVRHPETGELLAKLNIKTKTVIDADGSKTILVTINTVRVPR